MQYPAPRVRVKNSIMIPIYQHDVNTKKSMIKHLHKTSINKYVTILNNQLIAGLTGWHFQSDQIKLNQTKMLSAPV